MIIVRAPLRITFGGGGTDLPSYANEHEGLCVSATISRYAYVGVNHSFKRGINLRYSDTEHVDTPAQIKHPIIREAMKWINLRTPQIEIVSVADVPSNGAGLGNSGAFTVALLKSLACYKNLPYSQEEIAEIACTINMEKLMKVQGKQDEYASAMGGINMFYFYADGSVDCTPIEIPHDAMVELEENLMLFYTGKSHDTESILKHQVAFMEDEDMINNLHDVKEIGKEAVRLLASGKMKDFGDLLNTQWELKEKRMLDIDTYLTGLHFDLLINGAIGSKIVGSGMGGFIMVYAENKRKVRNYMTLRGLGELRFTFDWEGVKRLV